MVDTDSPFHPHRWTGYPGAICQDCGIEDRREWCAANHHPHCPECQSGCVKCGGTGVGRCDEPECENPSCPGCPECGLYGFNGLMATQGVEACICGRKKQR